MGLVALMGLGVAYYGHNALLRIDLRGMRDRKGKKRLRRYQREARRDAKRRRGRHDRYAPRYVSGSAGALLQGALRGALARHAFERSAAYGAEVRKAREAKVAAVVTESEPSEEDGDG